MESAIRRSHKYCTANIRGGHFSSARYAHAHNILRPQPWRAETCELLFSLPIMPPSKVCPKCQAIVPIRLKQDRDVRHIHNHIQFHLHEPSLACIYKNEATYSAIKKNVPQTTVRHVPAANLNSNFFRGPTIN